LSGTTQVEISIIAVTKNKNPGIKNVSIDFILDTLHLNGNPASNHFRIPQGESL
jgi:hypothetical protein